MIVPELIPTARFTITIDWSRSMRIQVATTLKVNFVGIEEAAIKRSSNSKAAIMLRPLAMIPVPASKEPEKMSRDTF